MLVHILMTIFAFATGFLATLKIIDRHRYNGRLVIDESDPDVDRWTIFYDEPVDLIRNKKSIKLKIERRG